MRKKIYQLIALIKKNKENNKFYPKNCFYNFDDKKFSIGFE